jgi:hypothetical protein
MGKLLTTSSGREFRLAVGLARLQSGMRGWFSTPESQETSRQGDSLTDKYQEISKLLDSLDSHAKFIRTSSAMVNGNSFLRRAVSKLKQIAPYSRHFLE